MPTHKWNKPLLILHVVVTPFTLHRKSSPNKPHLIIKKDENGFIDEDKLTILHKFRVLLLGTLPDTNDIYSLPVAQHGNLSANRASSS